MKCDSLLVEGPIKLHNSSYTVFVYIIIIIDINILVSIRSDKQLIVRIEPIPKKVKNHNSGATPVSLPIANSFLLEIGLQ